MKIFSASAMGQHLFETNQCKGHLKKTTRSCPVLKLPRSWRKAFEELGWRAISWRWRAGTPTLQLLPSNTNTNATKIQKYKHTMAISWRWRTGTLTLQLLPSKKYIAPVYSLFKMLQMQQMTIGYSIALVCSHSIYLQPQISIHLVATRSMWMKTSPSSFTEHIL